jgi:hypothetical protein
METLEAVYRAFEHDPPGMPRAADMFKNLKVRMLPPANSHPRRRDRDRDDRERPASATPPATAVHEESGDDKDPADHGPRLLLEVAFNPLHRQRVQLREGTQAQGMELLAQVMNEIEQGLRLHGATEDTGAPPPSKREKQLRQALRRR